MSLPVNAEVLQSIAKTSFYGALESQEQLRLYPQLSMPVTQDQLTTTYTSFGNVPEPRQLSGSVAAGGHRKARSLADYKLVGTVVEWEDTVPVPRSVIETNPAEIGRITQQMAEKASLFMDRQFVTALAASTAGYDGVALIHDSHPESGTNQDNNWSTAVTGISATHPTSAEFETLFDVNYKDIKGFTDDQGTPVNEGVRKFHVICPLEFENHMRIVLGPINNAVPYFDVGGGTGRFRGMADVHGTAFITTQDRYYIIADKPSSRPIALLKNKDWEFKTNIGTDSDLWNLSQTAIFYAYARFVFVPWDWKTIGLQVVT